MSIQRDQNLISNQFSSQFKLNLMTEGSSRSFKGSSDQSYIIFEINAGKRRIRHRTTLNLNVAIFNLILSRSMSDPTLSSIEFKNKMTWITTLKVDFDLFRVGIYGFILGPSR